MTDDAKQGRKRMGRPPKRPELGARLNVMFRLNAATRDRLMQIAETNGRSMSEEIEHRLEKSFHEKDLIEVVRSVVGKNAVNIFQEFQHDAVGGGLNFEIGYTFADVVHGMQINADNLGGDRNWTRERVKALVEEKGASEMIPSLLAQFPFPRADHDIQRPDQSDRGEAAQGTQAKNAKEDMQPKRS